MLARNTIANYVGQGYTIVVAIIVTPMYLGVLGPEGFGLIGFFILFSSWLQLLTSGLNPTLARQVAVFQGGGGLASEEFRSILRSLEMTVLGLGLFTAGTVWLASDWIAVSWLNVAELPSYTVANAVAAMGLVAAMRWGVSLYSSGLAGMEQQVWLNGFNIVIATMRNFGGLFLVLQLPSIDAYFQFQVALSIIEVLIIGWVFYSRQPSGGRASDPGFRFSFTALRPVLPFTLATTYSALIWVFITQFDKLLVSKVLPLELFGYFSFAILLANGVRRVPDPITQALLPRLTRLVGAGNHIEARGIYNLSTQLLAVTSFAVAGVIVVFPRQTLMLLTGNEALTDFNVSFLPWFAAGNGVLALSTILYMLQVAHGRLRLHVINSTLSATVQVPFLAYLALYHGPLWLGIAWFVFRLLIFVVLSPIVHRAFAQGSYIRWLLGSVIGPLLGTSGALTLCWLADTTLLQSYDLSTRPTLLAILAGYALVTLAGAVLGARDIRRLSFALVTRRQ
ncbi:oligosaccharide flippase family protein [Sulfitobacter sp.]|uniref:lipopolysaccharide biosynthesis protein n=1 Tax=Sulfitobacter sp. TaxID=1903071 RepID=UPI0026031C10|nr:oligosaccharide flippase family protein [Sulfitobacter sp.]